MALQRHGRQTYPFDRFAKRIICPQAKFRFYEIEKEWNEAIGDKHDFKVDDPALDEAAEAMLNRLTALIEDVNANPDKYFKGDFDDFNGYVYVCVEETPDNGKEIVCVKLTGDEAREWVETNRRSHEMTDADWAKTATDYEYSIIDLNAANGWYAYRRKIG